MLELERHEKSSWFARPKTQAVEPSGQGILKQKDKVSKAILVQDGNVVIRSEEGVDSNRAGVYFVHHRFTEAETDSRRARRAMTAPRSLLDLVKGRRVWFTPNLRSNSRNRL